MIAKLRDKRGYILLDILIGLFIFGLGFLVVMGLIQTSALSYQQSHNIQEAVNLAGSTLEQVITDINQDSMNQYLYLDGKVCDVVGKYRRKIKAEWETVDLLLLTVEIRWMEKNEEKNYDVKSLYYVQE